ncbi:2-amino-3-ketobutyrate CoA ligase [Variovorax paradoxus]|jgi:glycine C-acetyltransferase|uniref:glycine C-acetyltransferase n=1 Tax=Variovorax paradoxus TaxID=34073 RepID=UPI0006E6DF4B|nr:2-amino-3-ketobutyrate CoA ligase [Variovorax paradoxus]KPV02445.1 2-amino-3-ketobutyrate CoA ligase [Variovorax paradoxus]KPV03733.1 2-amino-3-ketobutyrate CoA ligase [Variovorax paradoxus]KPV18633.1 2-amino-3-ketobutyrate CoA ligase [Variovorax paradoxus]KPV29122.1 2-amino-3-ketobutyrate CoA ligase [Variovorax paradoxus]
MANTTDFYASLRAELQQIRDAGLFKVERKIVTPQSSFISTDNGATVINLCANNYLGLSSHRGVEEAAQAAVATRGFGLSSVRFICGTQDLHKDLEARLSRFLGTEDTILYGSAFDANGGLFEVLLGAEDAVLSDELNHASIIDGIRLCKAKRYRYKHNDLDDLREQLRQADAAGARHKLVFTDGVFSMDGTIARLDEIRAVCDEFGALLGFDDSHATGFVGKTGRGTHEYRGVFGKVDIITGTLGKALGGASGGFTSAKSEVVALLRQRSRPYLFSNSVAPAIVGATLKVLDLLEADTTLRDNLEENTRIFRAGLAARGFDLKPGMHPIIPVMVYDAELSQRLSQRLLELGVYVIGFFYPVVPKGQARIRVQVSAQHTQSQLTTALDAFGKAGREVGVVS